MKKGLNTRVKFYIKSLIFNCINVNNIQTSLKTDSFVRKFMVLNGLTLNFNLR